MDKFIKRKFKVYNKQKKELINQIPERKENKGEIYLVKDIIAENPIYQEVKYIGGRKRLTRSKVRTVVEGVRHFDDAKLW